ncbi:uncharacterized protein LOC110698957 [Chenopodium quinoa]|uniref:uncharacterized protein LOC110698957 n=1 Tax=Chenopodium quinoa TaxID=63459 RepID=UPI000B77C6B3|nr:uncharacterized protein LOC110698957 [Chenopodium quinoa]
MAANDNYHPRGRNNVKKGGKLEVDALTMLASSVHALTSRFDKFQAGTSTSPQEVCQTCNVQGHIAPNCPQNPSEMSIEQANALYSSNPKNPYDPYSNSYNEGWKHHPNLSYKNTQAQQNPSPPPQPNNYNQPLPGFQQRPSMNQQPMQPQPQKSSLEVIIESFITKTNSAIQQQGNSIQQLQAHSKLMESQISQLSQQVSRLSTLQDQAKVQKEQCNAVFLRRNEAFPRQIVEKMCSEESRKDEKGKDVQSSKYVAPPAYEEPMPFPQCSNASICNFVKNIKDQQEDKEVAHKKGPTLLYDNLPPKLHDPGSFTIPCTINEKFFDRVLCDLGASVNLMPYSLYESLGLQGLRPSPISLQLADRTSRLLEGVVEDVLLKVGELVFPVDFVVMDMKEDHKIPIIFGRPFLATS